MGRHRTRESPLRKSGHSDVTVLHRSGRPAAAALAASIALAAAPTLAIVRTVPHDVIVDARDANDATVDVGVSEGSVSRVAATQRRVSGDATHVRTTVVAQADGTLRVAVTNSRTTARGFGRSSSGDSPHVFVAVVVPHDTAVTVRDENGAIRADGLAGDVDLRDTNGPVTVSRCTGTVVAFTTNGEIGVRDPRRRTQLETVNGGISVVLAARGPVPRLTARSTNGGIGVRVPRSFRSRVTATAALGEVVNPFADAPGPARLRLATTSGGITISR